MVSRLRAAAQAGDVAAVAAALAAGAHPNGMFAALLSASQGGHLACVRALLAAGADPDAAAGRGDTPMNMACLEGHAKCIEAMLAAGADPAAADDTGETPLTYAVLADKSEAARALLLAAPELALVRNKRGELPLQLGLSVSSLDAARCLLELGALPPTAEILKLLEAALQPRPYRWQPADILRYTERILPLYAALVARQPLTPAEWARVPSPSPGMGAALAAVLARSEAEAALLVAGLPPADRERLRIAALCLMRTARTRGLDLPPAVMRRLLGEAAGPAMPAAGPSPAAAVQEQAAG